MAKANSLYSRQKKQSKMSLLGLLFFLMGSVDLYGRIQASRHSHSASDHSGILSFWKLAALGAIAASVLELGYLIY